MKGSKDPKPFDELKKEALQRESGFLSEILGKSGAVSDLSTFEADLQLRRNEILFKVSTEIEDTKHALEQAEELVRRLRRHLDRLESLKRILSR